DPRAVALRRPRSAACAGTRSHADQSDRATRRRGHDAVSSVLPHGHRPLPLGARRERAVHGGLRGGAAVEPLRTIRSGEGGRGRDGLHPALRRHGTEQQGRRRSSPLVCARRVVGGGGRQPGARGGSLREVCGSQERAATLLLVGARALLFLVCHLAFPPGTTPILIPESTTRVMYVASAAGAVLLTGGFSYLFRIEIDRAESAL